MVLKEAIQEKHDADEEAYNAAGKTRIKLQENRLILCKIQNCPFHGKPMETDQFFLNINFMVFLI